MFNSNPEEMRQWANGFRSWSKACNMYHSSVDLVTHQAFLKAVIDGETKSYLENETDDTTPVEVCITKLQEMIIRNYPMNLRRYEVMEFKQGMDELYSTFYIRMK